MARMGKAMLLRSRNWSPEISVCPTFGSFTLFCPILSLAVDKTLILSHAADKTPPTCARGAVVAHWRIKAYDIALTRTPPTFGKIMVVCDTSGKSDARAIGVARIARPRSIEAGNVRPTQNVV